MEKETAAKEIESLALLSKNGDREAFGRLYDILSHKIYRFIYYRCFHRETAEDITSQVFLKALENLHGFKPGRGDFSAWLHGIARNSLYDHYRKKMKTKDIMDAWDLKDANDFEIDAENRSNWERLQPLLLKLTSEERDILLMRAWDDMPYHEIAVITGKNEGTCRVKFSRIITLIRKEMPVCLLLILSILYDVLYC